MGPENHCHCGGQRISSMVLLANAGHLFRWTNKNGWLVSLIALVSEFRNASQLIAYLKRLLYLGKISRKRTPRRLPFMEISLEEKRQKCSAYDRQKTIFFKLFDTYRKFDPKDMLSMPEP